MKKLGDIQSLEIDLMSIANCESKEERKKLAKEVLSYFLVVDSEYEITDDAMRDIERYIERYSDSSGTCDFVETYIKPNIVKNFYSILIKNLRFTEWSSMYGVKYRASLMLYKGYPEKIKVINE